jgi:hypothetical protein
MSRGKDGGEVGPNPDIVRALLKEGAQADMVAYSEQEGYGGGPSGLLLFTHASKEVLELLLQGAGPNDPHAANPDHEYGYDMYGTTMGSAMLVEILTDSDPDIEKLRKSSVCQSHGRNIPSWRIGATRRRERKPWLFWRRSSSGKLRRKVARRTGMLAR